MADRELLVFVRDALQRGVAREDVMTALAEAGWDAQEIKDALAAFVDTPFGVPAPAARARRHGSAREAFLYIVYFALLAASVTSVGALAFGFVEASLADPLARSGPWPGGLRLRVAQLVVGFPLFIFLGQRLSAARRQDESRRGSAVRAWLTYVTLVFAALILVGDAVAVVHRFLGGEMSARFFFKALVVAALAAGVLANYARDERAMDRRPDRLGLGLAALFSATTAFLVAWAFTIAKSPGAARALKADEARLDGVETIVRIADCHKTHVGGVSDIVGGPGVDAMAAVIRLKADAGAVTPGCLVDAPRDPLTERPFGYRALGGDRFEVCATFDRGWPKDEARRTIARPSLRRAGGARGPDGEQAIDLPASPGQACFTFTARNLHATAAVGEVE